MAREFEVCVRGKDAQKVVGALRKLREHYDIDLQIDGLADYPPPKPPRTDIVEVLSAIIGIGIFICACIWPWQTIGIGLVVGLLYVVFQYPLFVLLAVFLGSLGN